MLRLCLLAAILLPMSLHAAENNSDFLRLLVETKNFSLGRPAGARFTPDGRSVLFLRSPARAPVLSLYELDTASGKTRELLSPEKLLRGAEEQLTPEERARRERQRVSTRGFSSFELSQDGSQILLSLSGRLYLVRRADGTARELPTGAGGLLDPHLSPDGKYVAYVRDRDLHVLELASGKETRLTTSSDPHVTSGLAEFVAQEEMGRFAGYWWAPDSRSLAFEEVDNRPVETFHIVDVSHPERTPYASAYPRPGKNNAAIRLGVVPVGGGGIRWVSWDQKRFPYLATVRWKKSGPLTLVVQTRDQLDLEVLAVDLAGAGAPTTKRLLAEHDDAWVNLDQSVPRWLDDGSGFLWSSEREGVRRLELRGPSGELVRVLRVAEGGAEAEYASLAHVDAKARVAYVAATAEPTEMHVYRVPLDGKPATRLTSEAGVHFASFAEEHPHYILNTVTLSSMPRAFVHTVDGKGKKAGQAIELPSVAESPPFQPRAEILRVGEAQFRAAIVRPRDFDARRKYPVIVDVYGGPHHLQVTRTLSGYLMRQWMADQGYIVVAFDGRGTPRRGRAWERAIRGDFATAILDDQVAALRALGARTPEMDLGRVGVTGWSFGGYMAALAVLRRPDVFQVGVAGAPVVDWLDYDTHYTERYLGIPGQADEAYRKSSLLTYAASLQRPLLLIHGTSDDNVYFFHTLKLADALFRAGKPFELLPLSGLTHMVPDPLLRERLQTRIMGLFASVLQPGRS